MNIVALFHAYKFTHFADSDSIKTKSPGKLSTAEKIQVILFGVNNPKPLNQKLPAQKYEVIKLSSNKEIECWNIQAEESKGTIILFHGYSGNKSSMLDKSDEFLKVGFNVLLVDFMGSGGSEGNQTTIGFKEAAQVKSAFDYIVNQGEENIFLFGTSMGAVAISKAISEYKIQPAGIILECPFGSMYKTTCTRFENMSVPTFPMAPLIVFWGGIENGFWAFSHNPTEYAKDINCPTLLLYGESDKRVSKEEINEIYSNLKGRKTFRGYPLAGHENYLLKYKNEWISDVNKFLSSI
jgi:hypothetical protein